MAYQIVKLNKVRCKRCGDLLISKTTKSRETCGCGLVTIGGGNTWLQRTGKAGVDYEELSVLNFEQVPNTYIDNTPNNGGEQ